MKKTIVILMSMLILLTTLRDMATYANFYIYQDYFAQFLCINKNKPELNCKGKCYLKSTILENKEKEKNNSPKQISIERTVFLFPKLKKFQNNIDNYYILKKAIPYISTRYNYKHVIEVFHPPNIT